MSRPNFPDILGRRELNSPGASAHKAGPSVEERLAALERGALAIPGVGVPNGSSITSDTSQTGGVVWSGPPKVGFWTQTSGTTGNKAVTGLGFKPRLVRFAPARATSTGAASGHTGAMDSFGGQYATTFTSNTTPAAATSASASSCILVVNAAGTVKINGTYVSMDADGFTVNIDTCTETVSVFFEAYP